MNILVRNKSSPQVGQPDSGCRIPNLVSYTIDMGVEPAEGGFGKVNKGYRRTDNHAVAIKTCSKDEGVSQSTIDSLRREYSVMRGVRHGNILRALELIESSHHVVLILDWCEGGDLSKFVSRRRADGDTPENLQYRSEVRNIIIGILQALKYIHYNLGAIHRDLKPRKNY